MRPRRSPGGIDHCRFPTTAKSTPIGFFVQDDWSPDEHGTINVGLRCCYETATENEKSGMPARVATALRKYPGRCHSLA